MIGLRRGFGSTIAVSLLLTGAARGQTRPEPDPGPDQVVVRGGKTATQSGTRESVAQVEARQLPGAFGDPFRAIEIAPGVAPVLSGLPFFYVRGAPPGNVGYYFDGVRVPYLFHFGLGPAVIQPALIARTDIHKGAYPAALGRWAGGVIDASALPPSEKVHGEGTVRAIDAGGLVEAPFANGRGSVLAGGRWSYTAALFTLLSSDTSLDYRDYQARVTYALTDRDVVSMLAFGAYDLAAQRQLVDPTAFGARVVTDPASTTRPLQEINRVLFASEFHRVDGRYDHAFQGGAKLRVAATFGFDRTRVEARRAAEDFMTGVRAELTAPLAKGLTLRGGADVVVDRYKGNALKAFTDDDDVVARQTRVFADRIDVASATRMDVVIDGPGFQFVPGARFDVFASGDAVAATVDPRLSARFDVARKVRVVHGLGIATQPPSTPIGLPAVTVARLDGGLQRAAQTSGGVEIDLPEDVTASVAGFHNAFWNLNDALGTSQVDLIEIERTDALLGKSQGSAYGLELTAKRKFSRRLSGLVSYTLSRSERTFVDDAGRSQRVLSAYDRTHVANGVASYDLGRGFRLGGRVVVYSGGPTQPAAPKFVGQVTGRPPERTPTFVRLDVRFEKRWSVGRTGHVSLVVEALNATLSRETTGYACTTALVDPTETSCSSRVVGPISVPSIGVEGGF